MNTKFGKVFIVEQQTSANGEKTTTCSKVLESVLCSNTDHKWYEPGGNLSLQYENYKGRPISVQFKIGHPDKNGQEVEFLAKVPLPLKLGELKPQDWESVPHEVQKKIELWESLGMLSGNPATDNNYRVIKDGQYATATALMCPGWKISEMKSFYASCDPYFIQDELIDKENSKKNMPFKLAQQYSSAMTNILECKTTVDDALKKLSKLPEQYKKPLIGLANLRNEIAKKQTHAQQVYFGYRRFHDGIFFENCSEWKEQQQTLSAMYEMLQFNLRVATIGGIAAFEMIAFDQDLRVSETVRESFLFRSLIDVYSQHSSYVNDLWSCRKEMAAGETSNQVYVYHCKDGLSLENAYQKTIGKITQTTQVVSEIGEMLIALYGEEFPEAARVVEIIKGLMYGNIQWSTITGRYSPDIIYDCIVELG